MFRDGKAARTLTVSLWVLRGSGQKSIKMGLGGLRLLVELPPEYSAVKLIFSGWSWKRDGKGRFQDPKMTLFEQFWDGSGPVSY